MDESRKYHIGKVMEIGRISREGTESFWVLVRGQTIVLVEDVMLSTHVLEEEII